MEKHPQRYTKAGASLLSAGLIFAGLSGVSLTTLDAQVAFAEGEVAAPETIKEAWVSNNGQDTAQGTADAPFATLEKAIEHVGDNGKVHVIGSYVLQSGQSGVYQPTSLMQNTAVSLVGEPGSELVVRGDAFELTRNLTFENIKLSFRTDGNKTPLVYTNGFDLTLDRVNTTDTAGSYGNMPKIVMGGTGFTHSARENGTATLTVKGSQSTEFDSILAYNTNGNPQSRYLNVILEGNVKVKDGIYGNPQASDTSEVAVKTGSNFVYKFDGGHAGDHFRVTFNGTSVSNIQLQNVSHVTLLPNSNVALAENTQELNIPHLELRDGAHLDLKNVETTTIGDFKVNAVNGESPEVEINVENKLALNELTGSPRLTVDVPYNYNLENAQPFLTVAQGGENLTNVEAVGKPGVSFESGEDKGSWKVIKDPAAEPEDNGEDAEEGDNQDGGQTPPATGNQGGANAGTQTPPAAGGDTGAGGQTPPATGDQGGADNQDGAQPEGGAGNQGGADAGTQNPPAPGGDVNAGDQGDTQDPPATGDQGGDTGAGGQGGTAGGEVTPPAAGGETGGTQGGAQTEKPNTNVDNNAGSGSTGGSNGSGGTSGTGGSDYSLNTGINKPSAELPQTGGKPGEGAGDVSQSQDSQSGLNDTESVEDAQDQTALKNKEDLAAFAADKAGVLPQTADEASPLGALIAGCVALGAFVGLARRRDTKK